ncbi:hypothetical protein BR93DRAFT_83684 [Coniochaeta sp. PMI_546]|nr:hypothetical protein BR93DRAFT_83684 [Coniochaeta sp. PMI_546]
MNGSPCAIRRPSESFATRKTKTPPKPIHPGEDQALLVWGNALLILNLRLHIVDGVRRLHLQGDGLACEGLDETVDFDSLSWD